MLEAKTVIERNQRPTSGEKDAIFVNWGLNTCFKCQLSKFVSDKKRAKNIIENKYTIYNSGRKCKENNRLQGEK